MTNDAHFSDGDSPQPPPSPWLILGYGRVGHLLERIAVALDIPVVAVWNPATPPVALRSPDTIAALGWEALHSLPIPDNSVWWITVKDDAIVNVVEALPRDLGPGSILVHCSGSLGSEILKHPWTTSGPTDLTSHNLPSVASLHFLLSVTTQVEQAFLAAKNAAWTIEGDPFAVDTLRKIFAPLGILPTTIPTDAKPLYHAAAVSSCGLVLATFDLALEMASYAGFTRPQAFQMLLPLLRSTIDNLHDRQSIPDALTGPVAREDADAICRHLASFQAALLPQDSTTTYHLLTKRLASQSLLDRLQELGWESDRVDNE